MSTVSVAIIAHNEERNAARALLSAAWADEIIFVDCGSTDCTAIEARKFPAKFFARPNSPAVYINKQFAADQAGSDWVFILDADETISAALQSEIKRAVSDPAAPAAFEMPRRNFYFGRWLKHGGKYPDMQLRLFRKGTARFLELPVHERLEVKGPVGRLKEPLDHFPYTDAQDIERKRAFYAEILTRSYTLKGRSCAFILLRPFTKFLSSYILKLGFLDGLQGLRTALMDFRTIMTSALLYCRQSREP